VRPEERAKLRAALLDRPPRCHDHLAGRPRATAAVEGLEVENERVAFIHEAVGLASVERQHRHPSGPKQLLHTSASVADDGVLDPLDLALWIDSEGRDGRGEADVIEPPLLAHADPRAAKLLGAGDPLRADQPRSELHPPPADDVDVLAPSPLEDGGSNVHRRRDVNAALPHHLAEGLELPPPRNEPAPFVDVPIEPLLP